MNARKLVAAGELCRFWTHLKRTQIHHVSISEILDYIGYNLEPLTKSCRSHWTVVTGSLWMWHSRMGNTLSSLVSSTIVRRYCKSKSLRRMKLIDHRTALFWAFATIAFALADGSNDAQNAKRSCTGAETTVTTLPEPVAVRNQTAPTGAPVREISDGQVQVPASLPAASSPELQPSGLSSIGGAQLRNPKGAHNPRLSEQTSDLPQSVFSDIHGASRIRSDTASTVEVYTTTAEHSASVDPASVDPTTGSSQPTSTTPTAGTEPDPAKSVSAAEDPTTDMYEPCRPEIGFNARIDCAKAFRRP